MEALFARSLAVAAFAGVLACSGCAEHATPRHRTGPADDLGVASPDSGSRRASPFEPSAEERRLAIDLAERTLEQRELRGDGPIFVVDVAIERDKEREEAQQPARVAVVTHYRYSGDLTIRSYVDLAAREVREVETVPHLTVPLADEELARARTLALDDPRVAERLGEDRERIIAVEPLVLGTPAEGDPLFGHRVVRLLFKTERGYLRDPVVHVDLTSGEVLVSSAVEETDVTYR